MVDFVAVAIVSLLAAISPGPDFVIVVKNSLTHSRKAGYFTALGITTALIIHLTYTLIGIAILITEESTIYKILTYAGAAYLFYIGLKGVLGSFKKPESLHIKFGGHRTEMKPSKAYKQGFLTNVLNPKCALFFISFFSQFITDKTTNIVKIGYAGVNLSVTLAWFLFLSFLITGKYVVNRISSFRSWIDRVMGLALMVLGLKIILF